MPRSRPGPAIALPSSMSEPAPGSSSPATMRRTVDLPQPEGPSRAQSSLFPDIEGDVGDRLDGLAGAEAEVLRQVADGELRLSRRRAHGGAPPLGALIAGRTGGAGPAVGAASLTDDSAYPP